MIHIQAVVRTAAFGSLLALLRLLSYALQLKGGRCNADPWIQGARGATRWVPIAMIYIICVPGIAGAPTEGWNDSLLGCHNDFMNWPPPPPILYHGFGADPENLLNSRVSAEDIGHIRPWFEDQEYDRPGMEPPLQQDWLATVIVYHFQATPERLTCWIAGDATVDEVTHSFAEELYNLDEDRFVYPLVPQPRDHCLHYVASAVWIRGMGLTPIIIDATACGGKRFVIYAGNDISYDDVQMHMNHEWPQGASIWHLASNIQMHPHDAVMVECGHVFAVIPRRAFPTNWEGLEVRIRRPWTWARDVQALGLPNFPRTLENVLLMGKGANNRIVELPDMDRRGHTQFVADSCGLHSDGISLTSPSRRIPFCEMRGHRCPEQLGVHNLEFDTHRGVFIDPREIGSEILYVWLPGRPFTLTELCNRVDIPLPQGWPITVEGAVLYTPASQTITFGHRTVLTIVVLPYGSLQGSPPGESEPDAGNEDQNYEGDAESGLDEGPLHPAGDSDEGRSRSPRRMDAAPDDAAGTDLHVILPIHDSSQGLVTAVAA